MKKNNFLILLLPLLFLNLNCGKKTGCKDQDATNYDKKASDGCDCCQYTGAIVFWYNKSTSDSIIAKSATDLNYYLDNQLIYTKSTSLHWASAPDCFDRNALSISRNQENKKVVSHFYEIKDNNSNVIWSDTIDFIGGKCIPLELKK